MLMLKSNVPFFDSFKMSPGFRHKRAGKTLLVVDNPDLLNEKGLILPMEVALPYDCEGGFSGPKSLLYSL